MTGTSLSRRGLLRGLSGASIAALFSPDFAAEASLRSLHQASASSSEADFWARIRAEFMVTEEVAYMNNGTLGPTPKPVFYTLVENYRTLAADPAAPNTEQEQRAEEVRRKAAAFLGAEPEEIALTRNTTEGMSFVANGLDLRAGDEVLLTFHEHPGGLNPWKLKAKRAGVVLKELKFPIPTPDPAAILDVFSDAITPRTRVISVSHMTFFTGCMVPVKELAALARSKGILTVVDGAHPLGMMPLDMHGLGVDFYATSPHKWLNAPTGTGLLYMRRESQDRAWPTVVTTGWDDPKLGAKRFDRLSQRAWPLVMALGAAIDFQNAIGRDRIEARIRALAELLRARLEAIDGVRIHTSSHPALHCGLMGFMVEGFRNQDVVETLLRRHHVRARYTDQLDTVRVSTHYYNTEAQVERAADGVKDVLARGAVPAPPKAGGDGE